ncbi:hypothetical protein D3C71_2136240 [compost metagenome]
MLFVGPHDHRMFGRVDVIANQQLLIELLARPQTSELDGDVATQVLLRTNRQT